MGERRQAARLTADYFTNSYRISGQLDISRNALVDILNDQTTSFIQLEDAYISPIDRPGEIVATYPASNIRKANLTLIVVADQDDVISRKYAYGSYYGTFLQKVFVTVPAFEVIGHLRLSAKMDLRSILTSGTDDFVAILDGQIKASIRNDVVFTGGGVLVNKHHIGAFCTEEDGSD
jgi:hypothetical protein